MSMYTELLESALRQPASSKGTTTTGEVLAEVLRCRNRLGSAGEALTGSSWVPGALADELAYDMALIELAGRLGIECDSKEFDKPRFGRSRIEKELASRGVLLDELDPQFPRQ